MSSSWQRIYLVSGRKQTLCILAVYYRHCPSQEATASYEDYKHALLVFQVLLLCELNCESKGKPASTDSSFC